MPPRTQVGGALRPGSELILHTTRKTHVIDSPYIFYAVMFHTTKIKQPSMHAHVVGIMILLSKKETEIWSPLLHKCKSISFTNNQYKNHKSTLHPEPL